MDLPIMLVVSLISIILLAAGLFKCRKCKVSIKLIAFLWNIFINGGLLYGSFYYYTKIYESRGIIDIFEMNNYHTNANIFSIFAVASVVSYGWYVDKQSLLNELSSKNEQGNKEAETDESFHEVPKEDKARNIISL